MKDKIRIALFDDNKKIRSSFSAMMEGISAIELTAVFSDCYDLKEKIEKSNPQVILMDIEMPGIDGIEAVKQLQLNFPEIKILMQTAFADDDKIFRAVCAGASGYILKSTLPSQIIDAIVDVYHGGSPMSPSVARKVMSILQQFGREEETTPAVDYKLTLREKDVLGCLVKGMSYKMIADALGITFETVRTHMRRIYEKLHVASMTEAVALAIQQKLV
jgi:DNA-binding NarL/FixJ family response regulator